MGEIDVPSLRLAFDTAPRYSEWSMIAVTAGVFIAGIGAKAELAELAESIPNMNPRTIHIFVGAKPL
jgi:hypothetical protein